MGEQPIEVALDAPVVIAAVKRQGRRFVQNRRRAANPQKSVQAGRPRQTVRKVSDLFKRGYWKIVIRKGGSAKNKRFIVLGHTRYDARLGFDNPAVDWRRQTSHGRRERHGI